MHWRQNHDSNSNFASHPDLYDAKASEAQGKDVYLEPIVLIDRMTIDKVKSQDKPNGERRNVAHFKGIKKPLALNVTNAKILVGLSGSQDPARWVGLKIQLYVDPQAKYPKGERGPAIRIRNRNMNGDATTSLPDVPDAERERLEEAKAARLDEGGPDGGP